LQKEQHRTANDCNISEIERSLVLLSDVQVEKVCDGSTSYSIGSIAERTADNQANCGAAQFRAGVPEPHG
jgi:hypothetical protein